MTQLPAPNSEQLRARYPDVFNRPLSAQLATPAMMLGAFLYSGWSISTFRRRGFSLACTNSAGSR
jgi:hypothetical protein